MENHLRLKVLELVGLHKGNHGRTCGLHPVCGLSVTSGTNLIIRIAKIMIAEEVEVWQDVPQQATIPVIKKRGRKKKALQEKVKIITMRSETVANARIWNNGIESCLVGFVSKAFLKVYGNSLDGRVLEVTALHSDSKFECERIRSTELGGLIRATVNS
jgi:hypothetical protein